MIKGRRRNMAREDDDAQQRVVGYLSTRRKVGLLGMAAAALILFAARLAGTAVGHSFVGDTAGKAVALVGMVGMTLCVVGALLRGARGPR